MAVIFVSFSLVLILIILLLSHAFVECRKEWIGLLAQVSSRTDGLSLIIHFELLPVFNIILFNFSVR